jgi:hypothetical protein
MIQRGDPPRAGGWRDPPARPPVSEVHDQVTMPGSGLKQALVSCSAGSVATGGGWKAQDENVGIVCYRL